MNKGTTFNIITIVSKDNIEKINDAVKSIGACEVINKNPDDNLKFDDLGYSPDLFIMEPDIIPASVTANLMYIKVLYPYCESVLLLDYHDITVDVELMRLGAYDFISNKSTSKDIENMIRCLMEKNEKAHEDIALVEALGQRNSQSIIAHSVEMEKVLSMAVRAAHSDSTVLITGESGTGKELIARAIHLASERRNKIFVPINIAALPEKSIESELFGHVKGVFLGAMTDRAGRFTLADGGTLFIDEIADIPSGIQVKLLRFLQFGTYERVGDNTTQTLDVRIIAATNKDLGAEIKAGRFRADLYYRINVVPLTLPALRDHKEDIPYLVDFFIKKYVAKNKKNIKGITIEAMARIMKYPFPGNVRELENIIERGVVLCRGDYLNENDIFLPIEELEKDDSPQITGTYDDVMKNFEKIFLTRILAKNENNKSAAAREISINERRLRYRLKALGID